MAMPNGIDCCNNQTLLIGVATTHFDWMGLKVAFNILLCEQNYFLIIWSPGMQRCLMSHVCDMYVTCHDMS